MVNLAGKILFLVGMERYRRGHNGADSKSDGPGQPDTWVRIPPSPP